MRALTPAIITAAAIASLAACATPDARRDTYEKALGQWQGASEETLRQRWGTPQKEEAANNGAGSARWLTYVVNSGSAGGTSVGFSIGGFGFGGGGHTGVGLGVGTSVPVGEPSPITCTTRFLVENGKVSTWNFDGAGCGA